MRPRWIYFSTFIWISVTSGRFLSLFLQHEAELDDLSIGLTMSAQALLTTLFSSVGGRLADTHGHVRTMSMGITAASVVFYGHIRFPGNLVYHLLLRCLFALAVSLVFPCMDGICVRYLKDRKQYYGKERLYGAISWAIANVVIAGLLDVIEGSFRVFYWLTLLATAIQLSTLYKYRIEEDQTIIIQEEETSMTGELPPHLSLSMVLRLLVATGVGIAFLVCFVIMASGQAIVDNLIFLYFEDLDATYSSMGFTVVLTILFEIPLFAIAPRLLERFGSGVLLICGCLCYIARVIGYSFVPKDHMYYVYLLEPLHGLTFACSQSASVNYAAQLVPAGYEASGQGWISFFRGMGSVIGLAVGGWAESALGPRIMYRASAALMTFGVSVYVVTVCLRRGQSQHHALVAKDSNVFMEDDIVDDESASAWLEDNDGALSPPNTKEVDLELSPRKSSTLT